MTSKTRMVSLFRACFPKPFHFFLPTKERKYSLTPHDKRYSDMYGFGSKTDWPGSLPASDWRGRR